MDTQGMPKGSKPGPLPFNIYCADIPVKINNVHVEQYTVDPLFWATINRNDQGGDIDISVRQLEFKELFKWFKDNEMTSNTKKTKTVNIIISRKINEKYKQIQIYHLLTK